MSGVPAFVALILGTLMYLSGMFPWPYLGILPVFGFFGFWGLSTTSLRQLWGGALAGILLDSFSALPFGTHILIFVGLSAAAWAAKRLLVSRYLWGDAITVATVMLVGEVITPATSWILGYRNLASWWSWDYVLMETVILIFSFLMVFLVLRRQYRRGRLEATMYAH